MYRNFYYVSLVIVSTLFCFSQPAISQVNILGSWTTGTSHTKESGTNRALIFIAHGERTGTLNLSAVTYGGQSMTKVVERNYSTSSNAYVAAYILNEAGVAAATSNTFSLTWSATPTEVGYASTFLENVNQAALTGASASNSGTSDPISTSAIATSNGDMVIDAATCGQTGSYSLLNGFTEGTDQQMSSSAGVTGYKSATGASETPGADFSATVNRQVIIGFVVQAAASDPNKASNPNPSNGAKNVDITTNLGWKSGAGATSHEVYFGTDSNAHNNQKYTVDTNSFDPPGNLAEATIYYWAVDSNNNGLITPGDDWNFKTTVPVAYRVADYIVSVPLTDYYATICAYYGVLMYSQEIGDTGLKNSVITAYNPYYTGAKTPPEGNVDRNIFGILPFELYRQTGDVNYLPLARHLADIEFANPRSDGLSSYTRFWIDDTYMIGSLQANAYKATAEPNYANHATIQLLGYMGAVNQMQQSNGLFYHTLDAPIHWGRGNGWAAASMTEVLLSIPENHPDRALLLTKYQNMMAGLLACQDANGMWYQVLNMPTDSRNWLESSCTGMFVFAMATGVKQGWLPEEPYKQAAWKGWLALKNYVDSQGRLTEVCTGTGANSDVQYYFDRPREVGNTHGQAAFIWAAAAIEKLRLKSDINADGKVDVNDLKIMTDNWLNNEPSADIAPAQGDGILNLLDFAEFASDWMQ